MRFNEFVTEDKTQQCPAPTQDITLNLKNRQKAIDEYGYGPLNPDLPNNKFWMAKVDEWNLDSVDEAKASLCGNCAAFDQRQATLDCIAQGIDSDSPADAEGVIDAGDLGYCKFLKFKCASRRTCDAWVTGGPLVDKEPVDENLHDWFGKEKWVRMDTKGNIKGPCARGSSSEGKPKCLPQAKAHALGKKGRASAAQKKRREDPNPERSGPAINVATRVKEEELDEKWSAKYKSSINCSHPKGFSQKAHCAGKRKHNEDITMEHVCPDCGMCETHGDPTRNTLDEACWKGYHKEGMKTMFGKRYPNCVKNEDASDTADSGPTILELLRSWRNRVPAQYAWHLTKTFGDPHDATHDLVVWHDQDGFKRIEIKDEYVMHISPSPHYDYCYSYIDLQVPHRLSSALANCSESILIDHLKNEVGARCASLTANAVTLNFVMDVVAGRARPSRDEYEQRIMNMHDDFENGKIFTIQWWPDQSHDTDPGNPYYTRKHKSNPDVAEDKRIPRKSGQPANSKKHSDLYTDENPQGTITGLKFATVEDAQASVSKIRSSGRSHAHKVQAAVAMEQRARAAGKASAAAVYRTYINSVKKTDESLETYVDQGVCPVCYGKMVAEDQIAEKQDACYHKVKSRYKVWPSAYASGALVQCRKKGAANWGNKNESVENNMDELSRILELSTGLSSEARAELAEEFDLIESIIDDLAEHNGVDAEAIWEDLESLDDDELYVFATTTTIMETEAWQKANNRDRTDGMSSKAVKTYRREHPGSKLQTAVTTKPSKLKKGSKASKRRKSYCSRSRGQMKMHSISCAKTPDKAICKARRRWNCE